MILRSAFTAFVLASILEAAVPPADAKQKLRVKPYAVAPVSKPLVPAPPNAAKPQIVVRDSINRTAPHGSCGAPPCGGGSIRLEPRDIRNFEARDIRSSGQRTYFQSTDGVR